MKQKQEQNCKNKENPKPVPIDHRNFYPLKEIPKFSLFQSKVDLVHCTSFFDKFFVCLLQCIFLHYQIGSTNASWKFN